MSTFKHGDGLIPGKYKISVECWEIAPAMGSSTPPKSYLPERYGSFATSGLSVNVEPGQKVVELHLDVPKQ